MATAGDKRGDNGKRFCVTDVREFLLLTTQAATNRQTGFMGSLHRSDEVVIQAWKKDMEHDEQFQAVWTEAKRFKGTLKKLPNMREEFLLAIISYTLEDPNICYKLNEESREWSNFFEFEKSKYKNFWCLLHKAITDTYVKFSYPHTREVYRGCSVSFFGTKGSEVIFRQFNSTSLNESVAAHFAGESGTVFVYNLPEIAPIKELSKFKEEEEIILHPFQVFQVEDVKRNGTIREIHLTSKELSFCHW
jgi:hypothetical protein